jgi:N-methylhydantoinase A
VRKLKVAVDIGGTFTDLVAYDTETHELTTVKSPSTPPTFIEGVMAALEKAGVGPKEMVSFSHGSTIATNAIIERRGAKTGLVTTRGFRDVLGAGRANRPDLFNSNWDPSPPLVPRRHVLEVDERVDYEGTVLTKLNEDDVKVAARKIKARGLESIAVAYLNSFMNLDHELRTKEILLSELDGVDVCTSAEILPEIREFERTSTVTANAYLMPVIGGYIDNLVKTLADWGYEGEIFVTHSGGGIISAPAARTVPARICHSGPAGGVVGGMLASRLAGFDNVITFDMGGTSADLSLVEDGKPSIASEWRVDWNIPILFPAVDLVAIGAGGGTIAWVDAGGSLRVGPQSAGADPGPACLDKGNEEPTITDAHIFLGRLNPDTFLGGDVEIKPELAEKAIERLAEQLGMSAAEAANGIIRIANANMVQAAREVSVERGYDPRDYVFAAGGGAGALHAVDIARELGTPQIVVPLTPGLTSALGILQVDVRHDFLRPILQQTGYLDPKDVVATFDELRSEADKALEAEHIPKDRRTVELSLDVRYYGQTPYLNLKIDNPPADKAGFEAIGEQYRDEYEREFGYRLPVDMAPIEFVNARAAAIGATDEIEFSTSEESGGAEDALRERRPVFFEDLGDFTDTPIYDRAKLGRNAVFDGPAVVEQSDTTVVVPPGASARVDAYLNIVIDVGGETAPAASGNGAGPSKGA